MKKISDWNGNQIDVRRSTYVVVGGLLAEMSAPILRLRQLRFAQPPGTRRPDRHRRRAIRRGWLSETKMAEFAETTAAAALDGELVETAAAPLVALPGALAPGAANLYAAIGELIAARAARPTTRKQYAAAPSAFTPPGR